MTETLTIDGAINFRGVDALTGSEGRRLKPAMFYRAGSFEKLTERGIRQLRELGATTLFDLRTNTECEEFPSRLADLAEFTTHVGRHDIRIGDLTAVLRNPASTPSESRAAMLRVYQKIPVLFPPIFRKFFDLLQRTQSPLVVNCTVGKDRTGAAVALFLSALGVPRDDIIGEYDKTNRHLADIKETLESRRGERGYTGARPEVFLPVMAADPDYMTQMFATVEGLHGSVGDYMAREIGVDGAALERLRAKFLEG